MSLEEQKAAFLAAIEEDPYQEINHYVYADWLEENGFDDEAEVQRNWTIKKQQEAEAFMMEYAGVCSGLGDNLPEYVREEGGREVTVAKLLEIARQAVEKPDSDPRSLCLSFDTPDYIYEHVEEFWQHFSVLTGIPVREDEKVSFIRCAC